MYSSVDFEWEDAVTKVCNMGIFKVRLQIMSWQQCIKEVEIKLKVKKALFALMVFS